MVSRGYACNSKPNNWTSLNVHCSLNHTLYEGNQHNFVKAKFSLAQQVCLTRLLVKSLRNVVCNEMKYLFLNTGRTLKGKWELTGYAWAGNLSCPKTKPTNFRQLKRYKEIDEIYQIILYLRFVKAREFK